MTRDWILAGERAGCFTLNLCVPIEFPKKFDTVKSGWSIVYIDGSQVISKTIFYVFYCRFLFCLI